jgi:hypothetical protein
MTMDTLLTNSHRDVANPSSHTLLAPENEQLRVDARQSAQKCDLIVQLCMVMLITEAVSFVMTMQMLGNAIP